MYSPGYVSKGNEDVFYEIKQRALFLTEKYKKDQLKVTWLSIRLPTISSFVEIEPLLKIAIADLYVKKFTSDNLILFSDTRMELKSEYLNRVSLFQQYKNIYIYIYVQIYFLFRKILDFIVSHILIFNIL